MKKNFKIIKDDECKRLLTRKDVVANILKYCVPEYKELSKKEILRCLDSDENDSKHIKTLNSEDNSIKSSKIVYDVLFSSRLPGSNNKIAMFVNLEAQNSSNTGYPLVSRALYYASRLVAKQKSEIFDSKNYGLIKKVYSIWICTTVNKEQKDTINYYTIDEHNLKGEYKSNIEHYSLINVIMLNLGSNYDYDNNDKDILKMLSLLFTNTDLNPRKVSHILKDSYDILMTNKEVAKMCTIYQGLIDEGIEIGKQEGIKLGKQEGIEMGRQSVILELIKNGMPLEVVNKHLKLTKKEKEEYLSNLK